MNIAVAAPSIVEILNSVLATDAPSRIVERALQLFPKRIAVVSSFGAESVVLLAITAEVDRSIPVIFLETGWMFPETLEYRDRLVDLLKLTDVRSVQPDNAVLARRDPDRLLWSTDPDACCHIRKVEPLENALAPFSAWITGRKRYQGPARAAVPVAEEDGGRLKFNPLAHVTRADVTEFISRRGLPRHPLEAKGFASIGCIPCTSAINEGEDQRAGRWRGQIKTECGIHNNVFKM